MTQVPSLRRQQRVAAGRLAVGVYDLLERLARRVLDEDTARAAREIGAEEARSTRQDNVEYRRLGRTGLELSEIGYGAWGIGGSQWGGADDDELIQALHRAIDLGVNFIDTALAYGDGRSERLVGRVVRERPETVFVATKVPPKNRIWPAPDGLPVENVFPGAYEPRPGYRFNFAARL